MSASDTGKIEYQALTIRFFMQKCTNTKTGYERKGDGKTKKAK